MSGDWGEKHYWSLDVLRGMAAMSVALCHLCMALDFHSEIFEAWSALAVEVFFVLSGFVLAPQIIHCARRANRIGDLGVFLVRRWMRTVPAYLMALAAVTAILAPSWSDAVLYALYVQNAFALHVSPDYFPVAWSLSVEEWFYVLFPAFILVLTGSAGAVTRRRLVMAALAFALLFVVSRLFADGSEARRIVAFRLDAIAYGFLLFVVLPWFRAVPKMVVAAAVAAAGAVAWFALTAALAPVATVQLFAPAAAVAGGGLILLMIGGEAVFARAAGLCRFLGQTSYSIYLFHTIFIIALMKLGASGAVTAAIFLAVCYGWGAVFFRYFEKPILDARPRYRDSGLKELVVER